jgi:hypothetical protein
MAKLAKYLQPGEACLLIGIAIAMRGYDDLKYVT